MNDKVQKAVLTSLLPQYQGSATIMERFLEAAHENGAELPRAKNVRGIKIIDQTEVASDMFSYFSDHKSEIEREFVSDLTAAIGNERCGLFCDIIANDWYDGKKLRAGSRVGGVKSGVQEYLASLVGGSENLSEHVLHPCAGDVEEGSFSAEEIAKILTVNDYMMYRHIGAWQDLHPNSLELSSGDIFLRRGLGLDSPIDTSKPYVEWDYINSYSLAISAPEKFAQTYVGTTAALINGDLALFKSRILFFSPFIPSMEVGQLEAGIIPSDTPIPIKFQGEHGGIYEYIIGDRPASEGWKMFG